MDSNIQTKYGKYYYFILENENVIVPQTLNNVNSNELSRIDMIEEIKSIALEDYEGVKEYYWDSVEDAISAYRNSIRSIASDEEKEDQKLLEDAGLKIISESDGTVLNSLHKGYDDYESDTIEVEIVDSIEPENIVSSKKDIEDDNEILRVDELDEPELKFEEKVDIPDVTRKFERVMHKDELSMVIEKLINGHPKEMKSTLREMLIKLEEAPQSDHYVTDMREVGAYYKKSVEIFNDRHTI